MYPNPTADFLNVDYDSRNSNNVIYNIVNAQGTIVLSARSAQIDVHMLPVGSYYLNILDDGTLMVSSKFVKF